MSACPRQRGVNYSRPTRIEDCPILVDGDNAGLIGPVPISPSQINPESTHYRLLYPTATERSQPIPPDTRAIARRVPTCRPKSATR